MTWLALLAALAVAGGAAPAAAERPPRLSVTNAEVRDARAWARQRDGRVAFAVAERGRPIRGLATARVYSSASVVKAMLLIAVLRAHRHRALPAARRAPLEPMVRSSDNDAASAVYAQVGAAGLRDVARAAGMRRFLDVGYWSSAQITAADQARLFLRLHAVVPRRHRRYARRLLAGIVHEQRWGIAAVADRHGLRILFKGGWRSDLAHQVARVEHRGRAVAVAVMTDTDPSTAYGQATIRGIASRLLVRGTELMPVARPARAARRSDRARQARAARRARSARSPRSGRRPGSGARAR